MGSHAQDRHQTPNQRKPRHDQPTRPDPDPIDTAILTALENAGAHDADVAVLVDRSGIATAADGTIHGATEAVEALRSTSGYLFRSPLPAANFDAGAMSDGHGNAHGPQITNRDQLRTMSPEQINAARAEGRLDILLGIRR